MNVATPFIDLVPKDPAENLRWRIRMREAALDSVTVRDALWSAAMTDVLFWFNAFCWCFEPRSLVKIKPFVTWPHQDPVILAIEKAMTDSERSEEPIDVVVEKSRAQGATWIYLMIFLRRWLRDPLFSAGLVSRNEAAVDSTIDPDTLMWKVAWMIDRLPYWMLPRDFDIRKHRNLTSHSIINPANNSTIIGYAATGDVASGGRKTVFAMDEMAKFKPQEAYAAMDSTQHVTDCRLIVSTYKGDSGAYYEAVNDENNSVKLKLDWKDNPTQNELAYVMNDGVVKAVFPGTQAAVDEYILKSKEALKKLERLGHAVEGKFRSPWYDNHCLRPNATPRSIAQELDMNPRGTVGKAFSICVLDEMKAKCCRPPVWQGKLAYNAETLEVIGLIPQENGPLKLWFDPGLDYSAPAGKFAVACDISAGGTGDFSSNSVASGANIQTGEQVLEYAIMGMMATNFAQVSVALAKWLNKAYLGWEASGPTGTTFGKVVMEDVGYTNVYYREAETIGSRAKTLKPGWWNGSDEDKGELFEALNFAMEDGSFIPRSEDLIRECGEYEWDKGKIVHRPSKQRKTDGKAHGDRCVAGGVLWLLCKDRPISDVDNSDGVSHTFPYGSFGWRQQRDDEAVRDWTDDEDQFSLHDLMRA
jgi:hypothetical protein